MKELGATCAPKERAGTFFHLPSSVRTRACSSHTQTTCEQNNRERNNSLIISHLKSSMDYPHRLLDKRETLLLKPPSIYGPQNTASTPFKSAKNRAAFLASQVRAELLEIVSCQLICLFSHGLAEIKLSGNLRKSQFFERGI